MAEQESALLYLFLELLPVVAFAYACITGCKGFVVDVLLNIVKQGVDVLLYALQAHCLLGEGVAAGYFHGAGSEVACAHCKADRNTLELPLGKFESRTQSVAVIDFHAVPEGLETCLQLVELGNHCIVLLSCAVNRHHNYLNRGESRRQNESVVVSVSHNQRSHKAGADSPGTCPNILLLALFVGIHYIEGLSEVLTQEMGCSGLKCFSVLHHCLDGKGVESTCESLVGTLVSNDYRQGHSIAREIRIYAHHFHSLGCCLFACGVGCVTFLPKEFGCAQERPGSHLPAHDIAPLVAENRQVAPALNPIFVNAPDDGLGGRAHNELFFQLCVRIHHNSLSVRVVHQAVVGNDCTLLGKSCHVLRFLAEE